LVTERWLAERLRQQFATRDEPLWRLLRSRLDSERWDEKPEDWEYELVDMDKLHENESAFETTCSFEAITLPYRYDPGERRRLRLRHGRVTLEQNGRLKTVNIGLAQSSGGKPRNEGTRFMSTNRDNMPNGSSWTREDDKTLLTCLNLCRGDKARVVESFRGRGYSDEAIESRLSHLLDFVRRAKNQSQ